VADLHQVIDVVEVLAVRRRHPLPRCLGPEQLRKEATRGTGSIGALVAARGAEGIVEVTMVIQIDQHGTQSSPQVLADDRRCCLDRVETLPVVTPRRIRAN